MYNLSLLNVKLRHQFFGLINLTHYQDRKSNINNELNLRKIFYSTHTVHIPAA